MTRSFQRSEMKSNLSERLHSKACAGVAHAARTRRHTNPWRCAHTTPSVYSERPLSGCEALDHVDHLFGLQRAIGLLRPGEDRLPQLFAPGETVGLQPPANVGHTTHGADLDLLLLAEEAGGHARVDPVREPGVVPLERLHDGGG